MKAGGRLIYIRVMAGNLLGQMTIALASLLIAQLYWELLSLHHRIRRYWHYCKPINEMICIAPSFSAIKRMLTKECFLIKLRVKVESLGG
jgi:hypothetical protein